MGNYFGNLMGSMYLPKESNSDWDLRDPSGNMEPQDGDNKADSPAGEGSAKKRGAEDSKSDTAEKTKQQRMYTASSPPGTSNENKESKYLQLQPPDSKKHHATSSGLKDFASLCDEGSSIDLKACNLQPKNMKPELRIPHSVPNDQVDANSCSPSTSPSNGTCYFNQLPQSVILQIFKVIPQKELLFHTSSVCKLWYELSRDPDLWRTINMHGQRHITAEALSNMVEYSDNVVSIDISDIILLEQQTVIGTLEKCPNVIELKMGGLNSLKAEAFLAVGNYCHQVRRLYLDCCFAVTDDVLVSVGRGCPQLEWLNINQCMKVSDDGVEAIAVNCPKLKLFCLDRCINVGDRSLLAIIKHCHQLERLSCMSCNFTVNAMENLCQLKQLRELQLHDVRTLSDETVIQLVRSCPLLESLNFSLCQRITNRSVNFIATHCMKIHSLYLVDCKLTDEALQILGQKCATLERLDVGWCQMLTDSGVENISKNSRSLKFLGLTRCDEITAPFMDKLVDSFPKIHYSTVWLDCKRLLEKAGHPVSGAMLGLEDTVAEEVNNRASLQDEDNE